MISPMDNSGLAYQVLGEEVDEDIAVDVLMGQGQANPGLLIRLDTSNPRDSPVPHPIGPPFYYNNPLPWINLL